MAKYKVTLDTGQSYLIEVEGPPSKEGELKARTAAQATSLQASKPATGDPARKQNRPLNYYDLRDTFAQGLTFNLADEAAAGLGAAGDVLRGDFNIGENYNKRVAQHRADLKETEAAHPTASFVSSLAGSLPTALIPAMGAGRAAGWGQRAYNAARTGAIAGGVSGFGGAEGGVGEAAKGTAVGATGGALLSGMLPVAGQVARKTGITGLAQHATQKAADTLSGTKLGQEVLERLPGVAGPDEERAAQQILEMIERNGLNVDELAAEVKKLGKHATIADVAFQTRKLADRHMKVPGNEQAVVSEFLHARDAGSRDRAVAAVEKATRRTQNAVAVQDALTEAKEAASPGYVALFAHHPEPVTSPRIVELMDRPLYRDALQEVRKNLASSDNPLPADYIDLRTIDEVKKELNSLVRIGRRSSTITAGKQHGLEEAERNLVAEADRLFPAYAGVRQRYATPAQLEEALELGRKYAAMDPDIITRTLRNMNPGQREHFKQGVTEVIRNKIRNPKGTPSVYRDVISSPEEQRRLRRVFTSKATYDEFMRDLYPEQSFRLTHDKLRGGSNTVERLLDQADNPMDDAVLKAGEKAFEGKPVQALAQMAQGAVRSRGSALADPSLRLLFGAPTTTLPILRRAEYQYRQGLLTPPPSPRNSPTALGNIGGILMNKLGR